MALYLVFYASFCWEDLMEWGVVHLKGKSMRATICKLAWWATVYYLWS